MKLYLSNKSNLNSNSNLGNLYKNKILIGLKKRKKEKKKKRKKKKERLTLTISIQHMWIFVYIVINEFYLLCRIFYFLSYVPEIFFLSYSFIMFRTGFLLSIWVNLHIYIDIVFVGLVFGLKFILIIFSYCIW